MSLLGISWALAGDSLEAFYGFARGWLSGLSRKRLIQVHDDLE